MKKTVLISFVLLVNITCQAQFIDNKFSVYFTTTAGSFKGEEMVNESGFISPSLFSNYNSLKGTSLKALETANFVDLGVGMDYLKASDWKYQKYKNYTSTKTEIFSISPIIRFHNIKRSLGFNNRFTLFIEIAPSLGIAKKGPNLTGSYNEEGLVINEVKGTAIGIKGSAGIEMIISQRMGIYAAYSRDQRTLRSFPESSYTNYLFNFGVFFRVKPNKYYFN